MAFWSRIQGVLIGAAVGRSASTAFEPVFAKARQESWREHPNQILSPQQVGEMVAQAIIKRDDATDEGRRAGLHESRVDALIQLALNAPGIGQLQEMRRRGSITHEQFLHGLRKQQLEPQYDAAALEVLEYLAPPSDLIRMAIREVFNPAQRDFLDLDAEFPTAILEHSRKLGISDETMHNYWAAQWELPSYGQLSQMLFRGELSPQQFRNALKALNYAPTWRGKLETIARAIPTITDFQRLVRRGIYAGTERERFQYDAEYPDEFTDKMALHGMSEDDARDIWAGGWKLPSPRQLYAMRWRGLIDDETLNYALKALDYPVYWRDKLFSISHIKPGRIDLKRMYKLDLINRPELVQGYREIGYDDEGAERMAKVADAEKDAGTGTESYVTKAKTRLWTVVHNEYVQGSLTKTRARNAFVTIGVPPAQRDAVLDVWDAEIAYGRRELTASQVLKLYGKAKMTREEAFDRLIDLGYTPDDANLRLDTGI